MLPLLHRGPFMLETINTISQTVAAIAVVASLIYLAIQTRQTAQSQRAMMQSNRAASIGNYLMTAGDPSFSATFAAGCAASPEMDITAARHFAGFSRAQINSLHERFLESREGLMDEQRWRMTRLGLAGFLSAPGHRATFKLWCNVGTPEFVTLCDSIIEDLKKSPSPMEAGAAPLSDIGAAWLKAAAAERGAMQASPTSAEA